MGQLADDLCSGGSDESLAGMDRVTYVTVTLWEAENPKRYAVSVAGEKGWAERGYHKVGTGTAIFREVTDHE